MGDRINIRNLKERRGGREGGRERKCKWVEEGSRDGWKEGG